MPSEGKVKMRVPSSVAKGDWVTVKALIIHPQKLTKDGKPENVLTEMKASYGGKTVVEFSMGGAISVNPMVAFRIQAAKSGAIKTEFKDDKGKKFSGSTDLTVG